MSGMYKLGGRRGSDAKASSSPEQPSGTPPADGAPDEQKQQEAPPGAAVGAAALAQALAKAGADADSLPAGTAAPSAPRLRPEAGGKRDIRKRPTMLVLLERGGYISRSARQMLERYMEQWGMSAFHAVLDTHLLTDTELADALSGILQVERIFNLKHRKVAEVAAKQLGFRRARQWECLPIIRDFNNVERIELVVADPSQEERIAALRDELGADLSLAVAERSVIVGAIDEKFPLSVQLPSLFGK